mmetsp:Transcript_62668/g.72001  ORF Transcript_62668/g.72001 Transcript_62668/m.72001 type:complete len:100 (-) Transcript_62668:29-328(-)
MDLMTAISFLHSRRNVILRDLKPDTIGFEKWWILTVVDFDVSHGLNTIIHIHYCTTHNNNKQQQVKMKTMVSQQSSSATTTTTTSSSSSSSTSSRRVPR